MTTFVPDISTKRKLFSNKIESSCVNCKRVFKIEKATSTAWTSWPKVSKLAKSFSTTKCIWAKRRRVSKRKFTKSLSENSFVFMINSHPEQNQNWPMECCNHFQEIRCKIDKHREEFKEKIDEISWQMIDQLKAFKRQYTTTNSDLTTISTPATTCFKIVRWRNARLER